jgi:NAD(P)-dependent dehydrogenase (short-subunit alcohol dehydrogenase family)
MELFSMVVDANLKGTVNCLKAVSAAMKNQEPTTYIPTTPRTERHGPRSLGRGCIVTIASASSVMPNAGNTSYVSAKHGVLGATKVATADLVPHGIRVNAVLPGTVNTAMMQRVFERLPDLKPLVEQSVPFGQRMASPDEIADAVVFLCSPSMTYTTGTGLLIDAGLTLNSARLF